MLYHIFFKLQALIWLGGNFTLLLVFHYLLRNSKICVTLAFAAFSNISLERFAPTLVSLTRPSLQILGKTQTELFPISGFLVNSLWKKIALIPEPVMILARNLDQQLNLARERKQRQKN